VKPNNLNTAHTDLTDRDDEQRGGVGDIEGAGSTIQTASEKLK
jgi:hypothetical protein